MRPAGSSVALQKATDHQCVAGHFGLSWEIRVQSGHIMLEEIDLITEGFNYPRLFVQELHSWSKRLHVGDFASFRLTRHLTSKFAVRSTRCLQFQLQAILVTFSWFVPFSTSFGFVSTFVRKNITLNSNHTHCWNGRINYQLVVTHRERPRSSHSLLFTRSRASCVS